MRARARDLQTEGRTDRQTDGQTENSREGEEEAVTIKHGERERDQTRHPSSSRSLLAVLQWYQNDAFGLRTLNERGGLHPCIVPNVRHSHWPSTFSVYQQCIRPWLGQ